MKMKSRMSGMMLAGVASFALCAFGGTSTWKSTATGGWSDPENWEGGVPDSTSTVVVPDNVDLPVYDADVTYAGAVSAITLGTGSRIIFNVTNNECTITGTITGDGTIVKYGTNIVHLTNTTQHGYYAKGGGMEVHEGILECPQTFSGSYSADTMYIGSLYVAEGAVFRPYARYRSDVITALSGKGQIQGHTANGYWPIRLSGSKYSCFEGQITGYIRVWAIGNYDLVNEESTFLGGFTLYSGSPDFGVMRFGMKDENRSSIGSGFYVSGGRQYRTITYGISGRIRYLGTGEVTDKDFSFSNSGGTEGVLDAGATGGLVLKGNMWHPNAVQNIVVLDGSNTTVSTLSGGWMEDSAGNSAYLAKTGTGTWLVAGATNRLQKGVVGVEQGTLQFDSLTETNIPCSFGLSTLLAQKYIGTWDATKTAAYAILLGSADSEGVLEWVGTNLWDNSSSTRPVAVTGRGGRIISSVVGRRIGIRGAFAADAGGGTLTLDGDGTTNFLYNVSDGHGKMSLAKEGSGTWVLAGDQTFSGRLAVNEGEVVVSTTRSRKYSWYRLTIRENVQGGANETSNLSVRMREIALYASDGTRINKGLTDAGDNMIPEPGQASIWAKSTSTGSGYGIVHLFEDNDYYTSELKTLCGPRAPRRDWQDTWVPIVMRLPESADPVYCYDIVSSVASDHSWSPTCWSMEASADGVFWDKVHEVVDSTYVYDGAKCWYSDGTAFAKNAKRKTSFTFGLDSGNSLITGTPNQLSNAVVSVASGAVLRAEGDVTICALEGGADGTGTIDGFSFAADGTFNLTGVERLTDAVSVSVDFVNVTGAENISNWSLAVGGKHANGRLSYGDGRIRVTPIGTMFSIR